MPVVVKGVGFDSAMRFAERESGERAVREVLERLGREQGVSYPERRLTSATVELRHAAAAWHAVYELAGGKESMRSYFQRMGRFIAVANLSSIYRGVLQLLGAPAMMAKRTPQLWQTYFPGARVETSTAELKSGRFQHLVYGFEGIPYIGPMAEGWLLYAFALVGARDLSVNEEATARGERAAQGPLRFQIAWRV